jgi:vacuolar iron transporter family protein
VDGVARADRRCPGQTGGRYPSTRSNDGTTGAERSEGEPNARHHPGERHLASFGSRLNWLRAGVLGANDGIVSVAGLVVGVAGVTTERGPLFTAGIAGLVAGAVSMALGEYVSVSSQRDSEMPSSPPRSASYATTPSRRSPNWRRSTRRRGCDPRPRAPSPAS